MAATAFGLGTFGRFGRTPASPGPRLSPRPRSAALGCATARGASRTLDTTIHIYSLSKTLWCP